MLLLTARLMMQAAIVPASGPVASAPEKKTCRRFDVTGSIIPFRRVCDTAAGWAKFDESTNEAWEKARYSKNRSWGKFQTSFD